MLKNWVNLGSDTDSTSANRLNPGQMLELMLPIENWWKLSAPNKKTQSQKKILEQKSFNNRTIVRY